MVTVFSEGGRGHARRRAEDVRAAEVLGCAVEHLGLQDAPWREERFRDFRGIVFGRADSGLKVRRAIRAVMKKYAPCEVVAPLAVGNHVDHRLVRDAALHEADPKALLFYEDRPYAFVPGQVEHALLGPVALRAEYFEAGYVRTYLRGMSRAEVETAWRGVPAFPVELERAFTVRARGDAGLRAVRCYESQLADLFADDAEMERLCRRAETYYRVVQS